MEATVPGISHVLTGRVIEFIIEALEKLNKAYGQPLPHLNVSSENSAPGFVEPSRSLAGWPRELKEDSDPHMQGC